MTIPDTSSDEENKSCETPSVPVDTTPTQSTTRFANFELEGKRTDPGPLKEKWFVSYWRPAMAWLYMLLIFSDFIFMPIFSMVLPTFPFAKGMVYGAWHPLTLEGSGLIHITFGTVLGITAWGRTKEKTSDTSETSGG